VILLQSPPSLLSLSLSLSLSTPETERERNTFAGPSLSLSLVFYPHSHSLPRKSLNKPLISTTFHYYKTHLLCTTPPNIITSLQALFPVCSPQIKPSPCLSTHRMEKIHILPTYILLSLLTFLPCSFPLPFPNSSLPFPPHPDPDPESVVRDLQRYTLLLPFSIAHTLVTHHHRNALGFGTRGPT
jgi:hypothetical protein